MADRAAAERLLVAGYYDWSAEKAYVKAYKIGSQAVPVDEPAHGIDEHESPAHGRLDRHHSLAAGAGSGYGTPGNTYFDEVRIATNWAGIVQVAPSKPEWPTNQRRRRTVRNGAAGVDEERRRQRRDDRAQDQRHHVDSDRRHRYSAGNTVNGGTVIYKGSATALEHVVSPGTTNFYKFYSVNSANYYSTGVVAAVTNAAYGANEKVNPFSYTNGATLGSSQIGGQGFGANYWTVDSGTWTVSTNYATAVVDDVPKLLNMSNYPAMAGNLAYCSITSDGGVAKAQRSLASSITTGKFYVAFLMSYQYGERTNGPA
jgi:hypothetical protein